MLCSNSLVCWTSTYKYEKWWKRPEKSLRTILLIERTNDHENNFFFHWTLISPQFSSFIPLLWDNFPLLLWSSCAGIFLKCASVRSLPKADSQQLSLLLQFGGRRHSILPMKFIICVSLSKFIIALTNYTFYLLLRCISEPTWTKFSCRNLLARSVIWNKILPVGTNLKELRLDWNWRSTNESVSRRIRFQLLFHIHQKVFTIEILYFYCGIYERACFLTPFLHRWYDTYFPPHLPRKSFVGCVSIILFLVSIQNENGKCAQMYLYLASTLKLNPVGERESVLGRCLSKKQTGMWQSFGCAERCRLFSWN